MLLFYTDILFAATKNQISQGGSRNTSEELNNGYVPVKCFEPKLIPKHHIGFGSYRKNLCDMTVNEDLQEEIFTFSRRRFLGRF